MNNDEMTVVEIESLGEDMNRIKSVTVTNHAVKRLKERTGIPRRSVARMAERAFNEGIDFPSLTGYLKQWAKLKMKSRSEDEGMRYMVYGDHLYIFSESGALVTVEKVPCRERVMRMARGEKTVSETDRRRREKEQNKELRKKQEQKRRLEFSF